MRFIPEKNAATFAHKKFKELFRRMDKFEMKLTMILEELKKISISLNDIANN